MARWRLTAGHYLNVPGTEWEYKETDRNTGKQGRKIYVVPMLLNPDDAADHNYPGEIVVCHEGKGQGRDIVFLGDPTPDMVPLDDEAEALSDSLRPNWTHPIESLPSDGVDYGQQLVKLFEQQIAGLAKQQPVSTKGVDPDEFEALKKQVATLAARNAELEAQKEKPTRRL